MQNFTLYFFSQSVVSYTQCALHTESMEVLSVKYAFKALKINIEFY